MPDNYTKQKYMNTQNVKGTDRYLIKYNYNKDIIIQPTDIPDGHYREKTIYNSFSS